MLNNGLQEVDQSRVDNLLILSEVFECVSQKASNPPETWSNGGVDPSSGLSCSRPGINGTSSRSSLICDLSMATRADFVGVTSGAGRLSFNFARVRFAMGDMVTSVSADEP